MSSHPVERAIQVPRNLACDLAIIEALQRRNRRERKRYRHSGFPWHLEMTPSDIQYTATAGTGWRDSAHVWKIAIRTVGHVV